MLPRFFHGICAIAILSMGATGQASLQQIVDAEHAFAQMAADKGTKPAFLAYMTDDAVVFTPDKNSAKANWSARPDTAPGVPLLSWAPNYADVSADGKFGYTTGNWEFRAKGKDDQPTGHGDFITIWVRQQDGSYKWVIDMGLSHQAPAQYSTAWVTSKAGLTKVVRVAAANAVDEFLHVAERDGILKAYKKYAAPDIRLYREGKMPFLGRAAALQVVGSEIGKLLGGTRKGMYAQASDLAYVNAPYQRMVDGKESEKGNYLQVWKFVGGKWQIVLDFFKPVPEKK